MQAMRRRTLSCGKRFDERVLGRAGAGDADLVEVAAEALGKGERDVDLLGGAGELLKDIFEPAEIVMQRQLPRHGKRGDGGFWRDERVAVAVAADPGAEADEQRQIGQCGYVLVAELGGEGVADLGVEDGDGVEEARRGSNRAPCESRRGR